MLTTAHHPRALAILLYAVAALYFGVHFVAVVSGLRGLEPATAATYFGQAQWLLGLWAILVFAAVALGVCAWRFERFTPPRQRAIVIASCLVGAFAAIAFEWWNAFYFLLSAYVLSTSTRNHSHA